jgi:hypothetical protein
MDGKGKGLTYSWRGLSTFSAPPVFSFEVVDDMVETVEGFLDYLGWVRMMAIGYTEYCVITEFARINEIGSGIRLIDGFLYVVERLDSFPWSWSYAAGWLEMTCVNRVLRLLPPPMSISSTCLALPHQSQCLYQSQFSHSIMCPTA